MINLQPSESIFLIGFVAYVTIRGVFDRRVKNEKDLKKYDGGEKLLLIPVGLGSLVLPLTYLFTPLLSFADYKLPAVLIWVGVPLMLVSLCLFWRSHVELGRNWSMALELKEGHQLVKTGIYRYVRHPMYSAIFLFDIAQGSLLHNWLAGWFALLSFGALYLARVDREERMMRDRFGSEYDDYVRSTGRLIPRFR